MIPKEIMAMATRYPGSPVTTAIIEKLLETRIPPEENNAEKLIPWLEAWEAGHPVTPLPASGRGGVRHFPVFDRDDLSMDGAGRIRLYYRGEACVSIPATVLLTLNTYGTQSLDISDLEDSYETLSDLVVALEEALMCDPEMDVDTDDVEAEADLPDTVDMDLDRLHVKDYYDAETECPYSALEDLAELLVDHGLVVLLPED